MSRRKENGQFISGKSGNPNGRPASQTAAIRNELLINYKEIINVIRNAALEGDMQACKIILDRLCPTLKPQAVPMEIDLPQEGDMTQIAEAMIRAAATGDLPPDIAAQLVSAVGKLAQISKIKDSLPKPEEDVIFDKIQFQVVDSKGNVIDDWGRKP